MIIFSLLFIPFMSIAADHCTNPSEYTIDKRCYVTDEQKKQVPYNSVVGLVDKNRGIYCTGTLAAFMGWSKSNKIPRNLITAKHCIKDFTKSLTIRLQDGREFDAKFVETTDADISKGSMTPNIAIKDWAVYEFDGPTSIFPDIEPVWIKNQEIPDGTGVRVVGYGALKIMSDAEISEFKQKYLEYLKQDNSIVPGFGGQVTYDGTDTGIRNDGAIYALSDKVTHFTYDVLGRNPATNSYVRNIFENIELKISKCKYNDEKDICQIWGGNSGGPVFNIGNNLIGVVSTGKYLVGGERHAAIGNVASTQNLYEEGQYATKPKVVVTHKWHKK